MKHKDAEKSCTNVSTISTFFSSSGSDANTDRATTSQDTCIPAVLTQDSSVQPVMLNSIEPFVVDRNITLTAEIYWVLKVVSSHYSFKSSESIKGVFQLMFPDSGVAKQFSCGEKKCAYLATFGIAPYFVSLLKTKIKSETTYVLLFDESLNTNLQKKQLDIHVRYWNHNEVVTRYLTSHFLGHATADTVFEIFESVGSELGYSGLLQLSMDGPNVNWRVFEMVQASVQTQTSKELLNVGSCGLHVLHNSFRDGAGATNWNIEHALSSFWWLFKDSPARREDFTEVTRSSIFPLKFCSHRWVENVQVAERVW